MFPFSVLVLALYIFLKEAPVLGWFALPDPKLIAIIGILFVLVVVFDAVYWVRTSHPAWLSRRPAA